MRAEARARLLEAIAKARLWLDGLIAGRFTSTAEIARHERCSERAVRITLSLALVLRRSANHGPEHPKSGNSQTPLPCASY
jgi:hypothetical protein